MAHTLANVALSDTFEAWRQRTNNMTAAFTANVVTTANTLHSNGLPRAVTTGSFQLFGDVNANTFYANGQIRGGSRSRAQELTVGTNTYFQGAQIRVKGNVRTDANTNIFGNTTVGNVVMRPSPSGLSPIEFHGGNNVVNNVVLKSYSEAIANVTIASNTSGNTPYTFNLGRSTIVKLILNSNVNINVANAKPGVATSFTIVAEQGTSHYNANTPGIENNPPGIGHQIYFGGNSIQNFLFTDGLKPNLGNTTNTLQGATDVITFFTFDGGQNIYGSHSILNASANNS